MTAEFKGYQDLPIDELGKDKFNISQYVNGICNFILNCDTPITMSIQGDWGSGKTSMMNMIKSELGTSVIPIWFNTWQFSQFQLDDSIAVSMMDVLLKKLDDNTAAFKEISDRVVNIMKLIAIITTEKAIGSLTATKVGQALSNESFLNCIDEISVLKEQFQNAVDNKLKVNKDCSRIVIFIDDLDRLQPLKAIELLEVLKLFLDCKNCVFVLAIDYEVVTLGIRQKYGSDIDAAKGKSFFDKIIQLPFKIPVSKYDIDEYVKSMMGQMKIDDDTINNVRLFSSLIKTSIGLNPRSIKRLFNTYQLINIIMENEAKTSIATRQDTTSQTSKSQNLRTTMFKQRILFATVCMQMSFEMLYEYLSAGNVDIDTINRLAAIDDKAVRSFIKKYFNAETMNTDMLSEDNNILNAIFNKKISFEDLTMTLQNLPAFIKYFMEAMHTNYTNSNIKLSDTEIGYLRDILKSSSVTSIQSVDKKVGEAAQKAIERRQKNREFVQKANDLLKDIGKFEIYQLNQTDNDLISSIAAGYITYNAIDNKKYHLRYVLEYLEQKGISFSIYINGYDQEPQEFYKTMGKNPLGYTKAPIMNDEPGWYFYDDIFILNDDENTIAEIVDKVKEAFNRLNKYVEKNVKPSK